MTLQEEEYFPRGGVGGEIKKKRNFVFEKKNLFDAKLKKPGRRERRKRAQLSGEQDDPVDDVVFERFEPLVYKGLSEGTLALCSVREIHGKYVDISMPGRLSARLYVENVSQPYYKLLNEQNSEENAEGGKASSLHSMFRIGQHINCSVLSVQNDTHYHVRVTSDPSSVNNHLTFDMVQTGTILQMAVQSVEDHGYMMFSGVSGLVSFLPKANVTSYINDHCNFKPLAIGQIVWCLVTKSKLCGTSNTVQVTLDFDSIVKSKLDGDIRIEWLNPGARVDVTVNKVISQNLFVNINGTDINGYIEESQLSSMWSKPEDYKIGSIHTATVLYKFPYARIVALTLKCNVTTVSKEEIKHGTIFENAEIKSILKRGVCLKLEYNGKMYKGMISIRRMGDNIDYVTMSTKFPLGNHIRCRVIGYDALEQVYSCSTEDKLLNEKFLSRSDLQVGQIVDVTVESFKKSGLEVSVGSVKGYVPSQHICDVVIQNPFEKVSIKSKHKAKVLRNDESNVIFTLRPTLVKNRSLTNFQSVQVGDAYYGWVTKILPSAISVSFFDHLFARIKEENLLEHPHKYTVGELVKCYVVECRPGHLPVFSLLKSVQNMALTVGDSYNLIVKEISKKGLTCLFVSRGKNFDGFLPLAHMCDYLEFCEEEMKKFSHGSVINGAILLSINEKLPLFTLKKSVSDFFQKHPEMKEGFNSLKKNMLIPVSVSEVLVDRIFVCAPIPGFNGKIPITSENLTRNIASYCPYEGLVTFVSNVNISAMEVTLSCHLEESQQSEWSIYNLKSFLAYTQSLQKYAIGSQVQCTVKKVSLNSIVVVDSTNLKGIIRTYTSHNYKSGDSLKAVLLYHNIKEDILHLQFEDNISLWEPLNHLKGSTVPAIVLDVNPYFFTAIITDPVASGNIAFIPTINDPNNRKMGIQAKDVPLFGKCNITLKAVEKYSAERNVYFWFGHLIGIEQQIETKKRKSLKNSTFCDDAEALTEGSDIPKKKKKSKNTVNVFEIENLSNDLPKEDLNDHDITVVSDSKAGKNKTKKQKLQNSEAESKSMNGNESNENSSKGNYSKKTKQIFLESEEISEVDNNFIDDESVSIGKKKKKRKESKALLENETNNLSKELKKKKSSFISDLPCKEMNEDNHDASILDSSAIKDSSLISPVDTEKKKKKKNKNKKEDDQFDNSEIIEPDGASDEKYTNKKSDKNKKMKAKGSILTDDAEKSLLKGSKKRGDRKKKSVDSECQITSNKRMKVDNEAFNVSLEDVGGFEWDATLEDISKVTSGSVQEDDLSEDSDEEKAPPKKLTAAEKRAAAFEAERRIREKEEELLIAESNPQSAEHFDRLLTANPNSSKLWIMYMAHHMQATEIEKARSVAKRALKHINVRLEDERLNIWIASLNLENIYGTTDSFKEVLSEALKYNDDYKVNIRVLDIYADSNKISELENLVHLLVKKYKDRMDCWVECQSALMKAGLHDKARVYLQRSLEALPTKQYCTLVSRFALLENKYGFPDQAHSLFENLLTSYPKRVDLWSVYINMLTKSGTPELARNVLERATAQKLPIRKMKALYQKWIKFEETFGTPEKVEEVKEAAASYVKNLTSSLKDIS